MTLLQGPKDPVLPILIYIFLSMYYVKKRGYLHYGRMAINSDSLIFISCLFFVTATDDEYDTMTIDSSDCILTELSVLLV